MTLFWGPVGVETSPPPCADPAWSLPLTVEPILGPVWGSRVWGTHLMVVLILVPLLITE